jgi:hypothetical protein
MPSAFKQAGKLVSGIVGGGAKAAQANPVIGAAFSAALVIPALGGSGIDPTKILFDIGTNIGGKLIQDKFSESTPQFGTPGQGTQGTGFLPSRTSIVNPLVTTDQILQGNTITAKSLFTPEGERLQSLFEDIRKREADQLAQFDRQGQIDQQQALLKGLFDTSFQTQQNALLDQLNAQTGGALTSPGGRDLLSRFVQTGALERSRADLAAVDRATVEQDRLRGLESSSLKTLADFQNIGLGQAQQAGQIGRDAAEGNQAIATQNFNTEGAEAVANNQFLTDIFEGLGDIVFGDPIPPFDTTPVPGQGGSSLFGTSRSPFSSSRQQFSFGGFG